MKCSNSDVVYKREDRRPGGPLQGPPSGFYPALPPHVKIGGQQGPILQQGINNQGSALSISPGAAQGSYQECHGPHIPALRISGSARCHSGDSSGSGATPDEGRGSGFRSVVPGSEYRGAYSHVGGPHLDGLLKVPGHAHAQLQLSHWQAQIPVQVWIQVWTISADCAWRVARNRGRGTTREGLAGRRRGRGEAISNSLSRTTSRSSPPPCPLHAHYAPLTFPPLISHLSRYLLTAYTVRVTFTQPPLDSRPPSPLRPTPSPRRLFPARIQSPSHLATSSLHAARQVKFSGREE